MNSIVSTQCDIQESNSMVVFFGSLANDTVLQNLSLAQNNLQVCSFSQPNHC